MQWQVYILRVELSEQRRAAYFFKVGMTSNLNRRVVTLQTGCPKPLIVAGVLFCNSKIHALEVERRIHDLLRVRQTIGEWFALTFVRQYALQRLIHCWPVDDIESFYKAKLHEGKAVKQTALESGVDLRHFTTGKSPSSWH